MKNKYMKLFMMLLPILLAVICLFQMVKNNNQTSVAIPKPYVFSGEYSYDGEHWYTYNKESEMSALEGNLIVKGHLDSDIMEGAILNIYCNHIGVSVYINGEAIYIDTPSEIKNYGIDLMPSMCGKHWGQMMCPQITKEDEIEFRFINYHKHGNTNAYKEALSSLLITPMDNTILEVYLKSYIKPFQMTGYALLIVAIMLLGATLAAVIYKSSIANLLLKMGFATLFAGGYMMFDVMMVYFSDELLVVKTYGGQLCLMLSVYFIELIICDILKEKYKKVAQIIVGASGLLNIIIITFATTQKVLLFDAMFFWKIAQCIISITLIVLCVLELIRKKKFRMEWILSICINIAILVDIVEIGYRVYDSGIYFKAVYVIVLIFFLAYGAKQVILNHQDSIKNKKLKAKLEQSRIAVMFSQIQPHFLYNSLTSVMDLCDTNPKQAKAAIADFSDYLRGNLSSLKTENLIPFQTELEHIKKYLKLEKLRFQDELRVVYDIKTKDFMLPVLSVQPLIENAVKHGVGCKSGGGTVTVHTYETQQDYVICIEDDGVGFEEEEYEDDGCIHVGIENTKKRLDMMMNAKLIIESKKGEGTKACILIPKRRE